MALSGDQAAYKLFLIWSQGFIRAFLLKNRHRSLFQNDMDDIIQEALWSIHYKLNTFNSSVEVEPWLAGITKHKLADKLRSQTRYQKNLHHQDISEHLDISYDFDLDARIYQQEIINSLEPEQRELIAKLKYDGCSMKELAVNMNKTESAIKVSIHRLKKKFIKTGGGAL